MDTKRIVPLLLIAALFLFSLSLEAFINFRSVLTKFCSKRIFILNHRFFYYGEDNIQNLRFIRQDFVVEIL